MQTSHPGTVKLFYLTRGFLQRRKGFGAELFNGRPLAARYYLEGSPESRWPLANKHGKEPRSEALEASLGRVPSLCNFKEPIWCLLLSAGFQARAAAQEFSVILR